MTQKQAKIFAKIHAGVILSCADSFMFMDNVGNHGAVPNKDQQKCVDAIHNIAYKILGDLPEISNSVAIYKYVIENY